VLVKTTACQFWLVCIETRCIIHQTNPYPHILSQSLSQTCVQSSSQSVIYLHSPASNNCKRLHQKPILIPDLESRPQIPRPRPEGSRPRTPSLINTRLLAVFVAECLSTDVKQYVTGPATPWHSCTYTIYLFPRLLNLNPAGFRAARTQNRGIPANPNPMQVSNASPVNGSMYLVVCAYYSKYPEIIKMKSTNSTATANILRKLFTHYRPCEVLASDSVRSTVCSSETQNILHE